MLEKPRVSRGDAENAEKTKTIIGQFSAFSAPPREIRRAHREIL
jgi:hypothetical protein